MPCFAPRCLCMRISKPELVRLGLLVVTWQFSSPEACLISSHPDILVKEIELPDRREAVRLSQISNLIPFSFAATEAARKDRRKRWGAWKLHQAKEIDGHGFCHALLGRFAIHSLPLGKWTFNSWTRSLANKRRMERTNKITAERYQVVQKFSEFRLYNLV